VSERRQDDARIRRERQKNSKEVDYLSAKVEKHTKNNNNNIRAVSLHVRVDDRDHLAPETRHVVDQLGGIRKVLLIPREVALLVRVLDVEPHDIHRKVVLLEFGIHIAHILLVNVIPTALTDEKNDEN
jgi:hypothetical protein